ncbi:response regulator transcription factor [Marinomonas shanghaiensis]|jgi:DNA-binding NarL/FixJ family response regulator|uniref:response regulator transcription factor n=1 Tax=Marinomonas shanghaiensis TaxID=2202418 RepID=UPI000DBA9081
MQLTNREQEVLRVLAEGKSNKKIASELNISHFTVRDHVSSLLRKKQVSSRQQLVSIYYCENMGSGEF